MEIFDFLLFIGFILAGVIVAYPLGYTFGRRSVFSEYDIIDQPSDILEAELLEERR